MEKLLEGGSYDRKLPEEEFLKKGEIWFSRMFSDGTVDQERGKRE